MDNDVKAIRERWAHRINMNSLSRDRDLTDVAILLDIADFAEVDRAELEALRARFKHPHLVSEESHVDYRWLQVVESQIEPGDHIQRHHFYGKDLRDLVVLARRGLTGYPTPQERGFLGREFEKSIARERDLVTRLKEAEAKAADLEAKLAHAQSTGERMRNRYMRVRSAVLSWLEAHEQSRSLRGFLALVLMDLTMLDFARELEKEGA